MLDRLGAKRAYDLRRIGVEGRPVPPPSSPHILLDWYRRHELVYACISKIADAAIDPEPFVERRVEKNTWERIDGHPLERLLVRPNPLQDGPSFIGSWLVSEHVAGEFYAEIVRDGKGRPAQLWPLDPSKVKPIAGSGRDGHQIAGYEFRDGGEVVELKADEVLVCRMQDIGNLYHGLSPLRVALGSVDADQAQTDYVRAFFENSGVPSGLIKIKGRVLDEKRADEIRRRWVKRYGSKGEMLAGPAVLDENADYEKIGSSLSELDNLALREVLEARICSVFGVPPLLVGALVGLKYVNQRASAGQAQVDFWQNKMSPLFRRLRQYLTWNLLIEFEAKDPVYQRQIRVNWDMSQVAALAEDEDKKAARARRGYLAGLISHNEGRSVLGYAPDPNGDYYAVGTSVNIVTAEAAQEAAEAVAPAARFEPPRSRRRSDHDELQREIDEVRREDQEREEPEKLEQRRLRRRKRLDLPTESSPDWMVELEKRAEVVRASQQGEIDRLASLLVSWWGSLANQAASEIVTVDPARLHTWSVAVPPDLSAAIQQRLRRTWNEGRRIAASYLPGQKAIDVTAEVGAELAKISGAVVSVMASTLQAEAVALAGELLIGDATEREAALRGRLVGRGERGVKKAASLGALRAYALGREDALASVQAGEEWLYVYMVDHTNPCERCLIWEGVAQSRRELLPYIPNPDCWQPVYCRCYIELVRII